MIFLSVATIAAIIALFCEMLAQKELKEKFVHPYDKFFQSIYLWMLYLIEYPSLALALVMIILTIAQAFG